jgi:hypothetical protein
MTFTYNPLSQEDAEKARQNAKEIKNNYLLLEDGICDVEVLKRKFKMSNMGKNRDPNKPSNPTIELFVKLTDANGNQNVANDWLIGIPSMEWKTRHFCEATDSIDAYNENRFNETTPINPKCKAYVKIQRGKEKPQGGFYPDKNVIDDYIPRDAAAVYEHVHGKENLQTHPSSDDFDDDIAL